MTTPEQLQDYYAFDADIAAAVTDTAAALRDRTLDDLADQYNVMDNLQRLVPDGCRKPIEVLTLRPKDFDPSEARVYDAAMATAIEGNMLMRSLALFATDPTKQLLVFGNPAGPRHGAGKITLPRAVESFREKSLRPMVTPKLAYISSQKITSIEQAGPSYGADRIAATAHAARDFGVSTPRNVFIDPVSAQKWPLLELGKAFVEAGNETDGYIEKTDWPGYSEVRSKEKLLNLVLGLGRVTNLVVVADLAAGGFTDRVRGGMNSQPDMHTAIAWGTNSELAHTPVLRDVVGELTEVYGSERVTGMEIKGTHHASENYLPLHIATVLQGLRA